MHGLNMNQNSSTEQLEIAAPEACTSIGPQLHLFDVGKDFKFAQRDYRAANYSLLEDANERKLVSSRVPLLILERKIT
jgi:hypothetical protein